MNNIERYRRRINVEPICGPLGVTYEQFNKRFSLLSAWLEQYKEFEDYVWCPAGEVIIRRFIETYPNIGNVVEVAEVPIYVEILKEDVYLAFKLTFL